MRSPRFPTWLDTIRRLIRYGGFPAVMLLTVAGWAPRAWAHVLGSAEATQALARINDAGWSTLWLDWKLEPPIVMGVVVASIAYIWRARVLARSGKAPTAFRVFCFFSSMAIVFVALCSGIDLLSDLALQSVHMGQHMLLMFGVAPLFLIGIKGMVEGLPHTLRKWVSRATEPLFAVIVGIVIMYAWHFPALYDLAVLHEQIHILMHLMFLVGGVLMWWPLIEPVADLPRELLPPIMRVIYALAEHFPMFPLILIFMTASQIFYPVYGNNPRLLGFTPLSDQVGAGIVMLAFAGVTFLLTVTPEFFKLLADPEPSQEELRLIEQVKKQQRS